MKYLFTTLLLSFCISLNAQITGSWSRILDIPAIAQTYNYVEEVEIDESGNLFVMGGSWFDSLFIVKYDPSGGLLWEQRYEFPGPGNTGRSPAKHPMLLLPGGDILMAANEETGTSLTQTLFRLDSNGVVIWATDMSVGYTDESGIDLMVDNSGAITFQTNYTRVVRVDPAGTILWDFETTGDTYFSAVDISQTTGDVYALAANQDTAPAPSFRIYMRYELQKYNSSGGLVWSNPLPVDTTYSEYLNFNEDGYLMISGYGDVGSGYFYMAKTFRTDGSWVATDTLHMWEHQVLYSIDQGPDGGFYARVGYPDAIIRYDSAANRVWDSRWTPVGILGAVDQPMQYDSDGSIYMQGYLYDSAGAYVRYSIVGLDSVTGAVHTHWIYHENPASGFGVPHFAGNHEGGFFALNENYSNYYLISRFCRDACPSNVSGSSWDDPDLDCVEDIGETPMFNLMVETLPDHYVTQTDTLGDYYLSLPVDTHSVNIHLPLYRYVTCAGTPYNVIIPDTSASFSGLDFGVGELPGITDMQAHGMGGFARPGFDNYVYLDAQNIGTVPTSGRLRFEYDPLFTYVSATPAPDSVLAGALVWNYASLADFDHLTRNVVLNLPAAVPIGTLYTHVFHAYTSVSDTTPVDNTDTIPGEVRGSFDPNAKYINTYTAVNDTAHLVPGYEPPFVFEIHFQNTGTDTAFTVMVRDTISADFDYSQMENLVSSHPYTFSIHGNGYAEWRFDNILLPDSNTNEPASHGSLQFRVPIRNLTHMGDVVRNRASIYFDYNVPVLTNDAVGIYDLAISTDPSRPSPAWQVFPNPFSTAVHIRGSEDCTYMITDLSGRSLLNGSLSLSGSEAQVSTETLPAGLYFLSLTSKTGEQTVWKIVKQGH